MASLIELPLAETIDGADHLVIHKGSSTTTGDHRVLAAAVAILDKLSTFAQGLCIGAAGMKLYRPAQGVLRQNLEWVTVAAGGAIPVAADSSGRALVHVYSATLGLMAMFAVEGPSSSRMIHGDSTYFSGTVATGKITCYCEPANTVVYVYNGTGGPQILSIMAWT